MLCKPFLVQASNFQCEHSFSKLRAPQLTSNNKRLAAIFTLIQLPMFHQRNQMTVLAIQKLNVRVRLHKICFIHSYRPWVVLITFKIGFMVAARLVPGPTG